jgi:hypothetical protein
MAKRRVDSRDVLDPNARTKAPFRGQIVGHYRPTGPNAWDAYEYVEADGGRIEVLGEWIGSCFLPRTSGCPRRRW